MTDYENVRFFVYLIVTFIMSICTVLCWIVYGTARKITQRNLIRAVTVTAETMCMFALTFTVGSQPYISIEVLRPYLVILRVLLGVAFVGLLLRLIAEFWYLNRGYIPMWLKRTTFITETDV